jgi:radical S-adenosyl methionine domain-containing protein 2
MTAGCPFSAHDYLARGDQVKNSGSRLKINTVVTSANWQEDLASFIIEIRPLRWKVMKVLPVEGQNSGSVERLLTHDRQFDAFVARHEQVERSGITLIPERNDAMTESYAMVDPAGRFFDNSRGRYSYSKPILSCGVSTALEQVSISREKFLTRGGLYDWR